MTKQELNHVIKQLNELGYYETNGKSSRELVQLLAVLQIKQESPHSSWF